MSIRENNEATQLEDQKYSSKIIIYQLILIKPLFM